MPILAPNSPASVPGPAHGTAQALVGLSPAASTLLPALWLADQWAAAATPGVAAQPTGFAALDAELPGGGWPAAGLTELLLAAPGSGELRLLSPWLGRGLAPAGQVLCIEPPFTPYAPALHALGWPIKRLLLVRPDSFADAAWAAEQGLRSGACAAVLWWQGPARAPAATLATALRRLHLAALEGTCPLFALRPAAAQAQSSPAPLRLTLEPAALGQVALTVFKRRGPAMMQPLHLTLPASGLPTRRTLRRVHALPAVAGSTLSEPGDAVVRAAPERIAA